MKNLIVSFILFVIGLGIGFAVTFLYGDRLVTLAAGPYHLPKNLNYTEKADWDTLKGTGWSIAVKKDWGFKEAFPGLGVYSNQSEELGLAVIKSPDSKTIKDYRKNITDIKDEVKKYSASSTNFDDVKLLKTESLKINDEDALYVLMRIVSGNTKMMSVLVLRQNGTNVYLATFAMKEGFYNQNKTDIKTFISSFD